MKLFPIMIYVCREEVDGVSYLVTTEKPQGNDGESVAVYKLLEIKRLHIIESLE